METTGSSKSQSATSQRFEQFINNDNGEDHAFDRLQSVVSHLGTNVLIADSERNLVYMNERSEETLRAVEDVIKDELGLSVDELMGGSIDRFHGDRKSEIAKTLSNPKNLPIIADIKLGPLTLALEVNAIYDEQGDYSGQVVNWEEVSSARKAAAEQQRLQQMVENSPTPVILADPDYNITYMNPVSLKTLKMVEQYLPCKAEEIVGKNIDFFHKDPSYQRGILGNPANLPRSADIEVGPEQLNLLVTAINDDKGNFIGPMVTWELVTEKRKAETEQQRLEQMVENSPTPVILADADFNITYMNPVSLNTLKAVEQYLPCSAEEIVGKNIDFFHKNPSYQRGILANPANLPQRADIEIGPEKLDLLVSAINDNKGDFIGPMVTWELVTAKRKSEAEQQRLQQMVENSPTPVILADPDYNITYMNPVSLKTLKAVEQYLPCTAEEIVGKNIDFFHKDPSYQRGILGNPASLPRTADIEVGPEQLNLLVTAINDDKGDFIGPMVTWELVTEKRKAETEQQRLQQMVENSPTPVILADADYNITYMNPVSLKTLKAVEQYLPCTAEEIVGKNIDFFHKNPAHQRGILGNPANLPHQADIEVGPEKLDLLVSAINDNQGNFIGPMVTWDLVTQKRKAEFESAKMDAMITNAPINIILADTDLNITYVNPATVKALTLLTHLLPVPLDQVVGSNVDIFHKNPAHQRGILSNPKNLPHNAVIDLGDQKLDLLVSAILDSEGEYIGPMVTWENITDRLAMEENQKLMQKETEDNAKELQEKVSKLLVNVKAAADGDLKTAVLVKGEDAIGQLGEGLEKMIEGLRDIISQITESADQFTEGAKAVADGSTALSDGAQTQSANVEEMSASIQSLNTMIEGVANNAKEANQTASETSARAEEGGAAVSKNIEAMKLIDKSAEQIAEIIGVISEIAAQTNLLALNAAIEAARAGEHGLGFAVVADEVRKLAERSSEAAKEINALIKESTQRVKEGAELSEQTGAALEKIIEGVEQTAKGISQIAEATNEQAQTATEVNTGVQNISSITENNASAAEEMSGSAEELSGQAQSLKELVGKFKL